MRKLLLASFIASLLLAGSCYRSHLDPEHRPTNVLVVLDRSGSMGEPWDHRSKWVAANDALVGAVEAEDKELRVGTLPFPTRGVDSCAVAAPEGGIEMTPAEDFVAGWRERSRDYPGGETPMEAAFRVVDTTIARAESEGRLEQERFLVLLLTDGEPNCSTNQQTLKDLSARWRGLGVEVHGIGLPGSEAAAELLDDISTTTTTVDDGETRTAPEPGGDEPRHREPEDPDDLKDDVGALI